MKPVVQFKDEATFFPVHVIETNQDRECAKVYAMDHPRLGMGLIRTSIIVQKFDDGSFETLNTIYKPLKTCPPCTNDCNQGRSPSTKKAVATSQKKSLAEAPETMGDVAKSREGHPNVFHSDVTYKSSAERMKAGEPAYDPHRTEIKRVDEAGMPASVIKHKQRIANMTPEEKAKKFAGKSEEQLKSMARRHGFGKDSTEYSKHGSEKKLDEVSLGKLVSYKNKAGEGREKGVALADKKMKGKAKVNASAPKHPYMEETLDEISRGLARDAARAADQKAANIRQADQRGSGVFKNVPGQMHDDSIAMKVAKHYEGKAKKFRDYADKKTPGFKQSSNELKKYASDAAIRKASKVTEQSLDEKLTKSMSPADVISDFVHSDDPKFKGKSKKERMKMALGAYYGMHPEKSRKD